MIWESTLLGHAKLEVKIFSEFFHLQSTLDSEFFRGNFLQRGPGTNLFILGIFSFTEHSGL